MEFSERILRLKRIFFQNKSGRSAHDHLAKRDDLDFFSAAMFVPQIAQLGNSLDEIKELGPEAERKLAALPSMTDEMVSATIYELLVGAACVRKGLELTMVPEDR